MLSATQESRSAVDDDCPETAGRKHPLGPLLLRIPCGRVESRLVAGLLFVGCSGLFVVAAMLTPDPCGVGTHTHLGLPPCSMMVTWGIPCPTCGMTTAFAYTVRGQWLAAIRAQPAGWLAAVATAVFAVVNAVTAVTGRKWVVNWYRVPPGRVVMIVVAVVLLAWAYRISVTLGERFP
ncbi:MAG: DUF2752 domain-containing protein [Phycisphaerae bacterium]|nr:DUF2752 domain-containing protein [Phycisphaerae bacterium]